MHLSVQVVLVICAAVVTVALVPTILALRQAILRAERVLGLAERDIPPLVAEIHELTRDLMQVSRQTKEELDRIGALAGRAEDVADGLGRVITAVAGLSRAGQLVGVAAGLKTGVDVFLNRFRKQQGDNNG